MQECRVYEDSSQDLVTQDVRIDYKWEDIMKHDRRKARPHSSAIAIGSS